jgi:hypothetical protein
MRFAVLEGSKIGVIIGVSLEPPPIPAIILPLTLVLTPVRVSHHAHALAQDFFSIVKFVVG